MKTYHRSLYYPKSQEEPARSQEIKAILEEIRWLRDMAWLETRMWGSWSNYENIEGGS